MIIKYIKDFWMDILNFMLVLFLSSISFYLLTEGKIEETVGDVVSITNEVIIRVLLTLPVLSVTVMVQSE